MKIEEVKTLLDDMNREVTEVLDKYLAMLPERSDIFVLNNSDASLMEKRRGKYCEVNVIINASELES